MTPQSIPIHYDYGLLTINLPVFFEKQTVGRTRKVLRMLGKYPYENIDAFDRLDQFFPSWARDVKDLLELRRVELAAAKRDAETNHQRSVRTVKRLENAVKQAESAIDRCGVIIAAYETVRAKVLTFK